MGCVRQGFLNHSVTLLSTNSVVGIDVFRFDRSRGSKHYTKRTKLTIQYW
ncbi:ISH9-type transposase [Haloferax mucosum ATCC BAA-1512]|uniref:ISH9-type transposase n=1 Tax=Haloferax mucosum ATCC BAA-1512 TaxID=662479 RepID=M0IGD8_9EURY|nr:ISH9-type transposase [Haloferax mucosum ATCC BAA-1512]